LSPSSDRSDKSKCFIHIKHQNTSKKGGIYFRKMSMQYSSKTTELSINAAGQVTFVGCPNGENLVRESLPFARLAYFTPRPAFTNEWIHPLSSEKPLYVNASAAEGTDKTLTLRFENDAEVQLDVEARVNGIRFAVRSFLGNGSKQPAVLRFAQIAPLTDRESVCIGMSLNLKTDAADLPGIFPLLYAEAYSHFGLAGSAFIVATTLKSQLRSLMQQITQNETEHIPWMPCSGAFAKDAKEMQGSYLMSYGAYLPGSLTPQNLDGWIAMLKAIGITQVDFHGAEGKNFSFGDFEPYRPIFPEGRESLRAVVNRLHENGIQSILHSYSSLIDPNCTLVHPKPDPLLGYNRCFTLTSDIDATTKQIPIAEDTAEISLIHTSHFNSTRYVLWDDEIIEFTALGDQLLDQCVRGAFGTVPAAHCKGAAGHNLKNSYGLFAPDIDGPLFHKVAQNTADCFNECGFDAIYFDALEGVNTLEGSIFLFYYSTKFVYEVAKRLHKPAGMEMSSMFHNLWYVRSRMGAWDRPSRAQKKFLDRHAEVNRASQQNTLLPQNLGWWYLGVNSAKNPVEADRITTDVYENMGRLGLANDFSLSFQGLALEVFEKCEEVRRFAEMIRRYEKLRLSGKLTPQEKDCVNDRECHLCQDGLYPAYYSQAVAEFQQGDAEIVLDNPCEPQTPFLLRFEPLHNRTKNKSAVKTTKGSDAPDTDQLVNPQYSSLGDAEQPAPEKEVALMPVQNFASIAVFTSRTVKAEISRQASPHGDAVRFTATAQKPIGCARFEQRFTPPLNLQGQYGFGVWIHGDGNGEVLNFQLRSIRLQASGLCEKLVKIDFTGWKYCALIENGAAQVMEYLWPYYHRQLDPEMEFAPTEFENEGNDWPDSMYFNNHRVTGNPCHITAELPDFTRIAVSSVWMNHLPAGKTCAVMIADWHSFFTEERPVAALQMGEIRVAGVFPPNSIAEFSDGSWFTGDADSLPLALQIQGKPELLKAGKNTLRLKAEVPDGTRLKVVAGIIDQTPLVKF
ncbi:MAG: hypothetical protein WCT05_02585, partial [Lentisphaeria bacterium]